MSNKKEIIEELLEKISYLQLSDITALQEGQARILQQRNSDFASAIQNSDIKKLQQLVELGINFNDPEFWKKLSKVQLIKTNKATVEYLMGLNIEAKPIMGDIFPFRHIDIRKDAIIDPIIAFKINFRERMKNNLMYYNFTDENFESTKKYLDSKDFLILATTAIKNFAGFPSIKEYPSVHAYVKSNEKLISILFNNIRTEENLEQFLSHQEYKDFIENKVKTENSEDIMNSAVSDAAFAKIKVLHEMGVKLPNSKAPYSNLFQKTIDTSILSQKYVLRNLDDITFNNQIVLKTLLHSSTNGNKEELIKEVLERYNNECTSAQIVELIPVALAKREENQEVLLVKKFYEYHILKKSTEENASGLDRKKMKI